MTGTGYLYNTCVVALTVLVGCLSMVCNDCNRSLTRGGRYYANAADEPCW